MKTSDSKQDRAIPPDYIAIRPKGGSITLCAEEETTAALGALHIVAAEPQSRRPQLA